MKRFFYLAILATLLVFFSPSCQNPLETNGLTALAKGQKPEMVEPASPGDLIAGKHLKVGTVTTSNDEDGLHVTFSLVGGWVLTESHLAIALSLDGIPQTGSGNPIPGQFNYNMMHVPPTADYQYTISLGECGFTEDSLVYLAAHAEVQKVDVSGFIIQEESAWAAGYPCQVFDGKNWATYFTYCEECIWEGDYSIEGVCDLVGYTGITGSLTISHTNLVNLSWLSSLTFVGGNLTIEYNPILASLQGLEALTSIGGDVMIEQNASLTTLTGLENLSSVGGGFWIEANHALTSLSALESLNSIGDYFRIHYSGSLMSLTGLEGLTSLNNLSIRSCDSLTTLNGLEGLTSLNGGLWIRNSHNLTSLSGLENLTSISGGLWVHFNESLPNLIGLDGLTSLDGTSIYTNDSLTDLTGLGGLTSLDWININDNPSLTSLEGLENITSINEYLKIYNLLSAGRKSTFSRFMTSCESTSDLRYI